MSKYTNLIEVEELAELIKNDSANLRIFDCRFDLANPQSGFEEYKLSHITDAHYLHLDNDISGKKTGKNGRHPLPDKIIFAQKLANCGVDNHSQIVVYDNDLGIYAARVWWMVREMGHLQVAVLNGGYRAWINTGLPASKKNTQKTQNVNVEKNEFIINQNCWRSVTANDILDNVINPKFLLIDARSAERFEGKNETLDSVGGHIPWAINRCFQNNLELESKNDSLRFKPACVIKTEFLKLINDQKPQNIVHSCGSGVTACHNLLAMEYAGLFGSNLYVGSWSEWCANPNNPCVK